MAEMQRKTALFKMGLLKPGIHSGPNPCIEQKTLTILMPLFRPVSNRCCQCSISLPTLNFQWEVHKKFLPSHSLQKVNVPNLLCAVQSEISLWRISICTATIKVGFLSASCSLPWRKQIKMGERVSSAAEGTQPLTCVTKIVFANKW